jgi:hypothetical protein
MLNFYQTYGIFVKANVVSLNGIQQQKMPMEITGKDGRLEGKSESNKCL